MKTKLYAALLFSICMFGAAACFWYSSSTYTYNGQQWAYFCGKRSASSPVQPIGACRLDTIDQQGNPACSLTVPSEMGTWAGYGMTDASGCALTLSDPQQPVVPAKCSPANFRIWNFNGAPGLGQGQRGPVPVGGLPACPVP